MAYNKSKQHQSLRSLDSRSVFSIVHGYSIFAQALTLQVCRCLRRSNMKFLRFLVLILATQGVCAHEAESEMDFPEKYEVLTISHDEVMWFNGAIASFRELYQELDALTLSGDEVTLLLAVDSGVNKQGEFYRQLVQSLRSRRNVTLRLGRQYE